MGHEFLEVLQSTSAHAFSNVILWVVISFFFFEVINYLSNNGFSNIIKNNRKLQPLLGSLMGSIPGSGSTLFLLPIYKKKELSFAGLTAAFIATMGEVAFVVMAQQPILYLWMVLFSFIVSLIIGYTLYFIDIETKLNIHIQDKDIDNYKVHKHNEQYNYPKNKYYNTFIDIILPILFFISIILAIPMFILEVMHGGHNHGSDHNHSSSFEKFLLWYFFIVSIIFIIAFILDRTILKKLKKDNPVHIHSYKRENIKKDLKHILKDTYNNSLFIFIWVFISMLIVEVPFKFIPGLPNNIVSLFDETWFIVSLIFVGTIISIIPGCGPNLVFTSWFLSIASHASVPFTLPFAIMVANGIAQDGDSGFPLLAMNKKSYAIMKGINIIVGIVFGLALIPLSTILPGITS